MNKPIIALALLLAAVTPSVHAQDGAAYYGLSLGEMDYTDQPFSDSASTWHLMVAYQFNEHLAVEGSYGQTNTIRATQTFPGQLPGQVDEVSYATEFGKILTVRLLGVLPFDWGVSFRAGVGYAAVDQDIDLAVNGRPFASGEISGSDPAYFVGVQYDWDRFAMRLGYEKYDFDQVDADETSLTFFYKL
jgi:hypothetical protein